MFIITLITDLILLVLARSWGNTLTETEKSRKPLYFFYLVLVVLSAIAVRYVGVHYPGQRFAPTAMKSGASLPALALGLQGFLHEKRWFLLR